MRIKPKLIDSKVLDKLRKKINVGNCNKLSLKVNIGIIIIFFLILILLFYIYTEKYNSVAE